jgi:hypothetical protein
LPFLSPPSLSHTLLFSECHSINTRIRSVSSIDKTRLEEEDEDAEDTRKEDEENELSGRDEDKT